ncbi:tetratricopeptide repeat protein [Thermodesulfitimonas sp.]
MGLRVLEYRPEAKEALKVVFAGEFFTRTPEAEFNRKLALALFGEGVNLGLLNRGSRDWGLGEVEEGHLRLLELRLLEQLEEDLLPEPDFCLCQEKEDLGISETRVFRLITEGASCKRDGYACLVAELKPHGSSWREAAQALKRQLESLRHQPISWEIPGGDFAICFFIAPTQAQLAEETRRSLSFMNPESMLVPLSLGELQGLSPETKLLLLEEGETLAVEDREAFEKVFFSPEEKVTFLEVIPLDAWGLENLVVPSTRFLSKRVVEEIPAPADRVPLFYQGRWAPVRIIRPQFLAEKRRRRLLGRNIPEIPAYHYHHLLAVDALATGRPKEAITAFQAAYREAPDPYRALVLRNLALALINQGRYEEAIGLLRDGRKLYPAYTDLGYLTGIAHWKQRCYDDALQESLQAVEKGEAIGWYYSDPGTGNYKPIFLTAEIYRKKGNSNGAIAAYLGSITYNTYFLPALQRLGQMDLDSPAVTRKILELLFLLLDLHQPEVKATLSQNLERYSKAFTFEFREQSYYYFYHHDNRTWENEAAVEIPIIWRIVKESQDKRILEVGNVLSRYFPVSHDILDKYEKALGILNEDGVDFVPSKKYDLIISISALKHVGGGGYVEEAEKLLRALEILKGVLSHEGKMVVTLPVGYNPELDKMLADGRLSFTECYGLKRVSAANEWVEVPWQEVLGLDYGRPYSAANGLIIGYWGKMSGERVTKGDSPGHASNITDYSSLSVAEIKQLMDQRYASESAYNNVCL